MFKSAARNFLDRLGYEIRRKPPEEGSDWIGSTLAPFPSKGSLPRDRFREIVSDPINILIERHPFAGVVRGGTVKLHTGLVVPVSGSGAYYGDFSDILVINRGVHEPLEEFCFQEMKRTMGSTPTMLELGAYWGHYSMWMQQARPHAQLYLVEPEQTNLKVGFDNFQRNKLKGGTFINDIVGPGRFEVDRFMRDRGINRLDVLHADIQGAELLMLEGCSKAFRNGTIKHCFVSTHSQDIHTKTLETLRTANFRIEANADYDHETTSNDGLVFAVHDSAPAVLREFTYMGREELTAASPDKILEAVARYRAARNVGPSSLARTE